MGFDRGGDAEESEDGHGSRVPAIAKACGEWHTPDQAGAARRYKRADKDGSSRADREEATEVAQGQDEKGHA